MKILTGALPFSCSVAIILITASSLSELRALFLERRQGLQHPEQSWPTCSWPMIWMTLINDWPPISSPIPSHGHHILFFFFITSLYTCPILLARYHPWPLHGPGFHWLLVLYYRCSIFSRVLLSSVLIHSLFIVSHIPVNSTSTFHYVLSQPHYLFLSLSATMAFPVYCTFCYSGLSIVLVCHELETWIPHWLLDLEPAQLILNSPHALDVVILKTIICWSERRYIGL